MPRFASSPSTTGRTATSAGRRSSPRSAAGPYRISKFDFGRSVTYERVADYWGADLPTMKGRFNFDRVRYDYFRGRTHHAGGPQGRHHRHPPGDRVEELGPLSTTSPPSAPASSSASCSTSPGLGGCGGPRSGTWTGRAFQDPRVREALWLLYDFPYINRVILFGFYDPRPQLLPQLEDGAVGLALAGRTGAPGALSRPAPGAPVHAAVPSPVLGRVRLQPGQHGAGHRPLPRRRVG